MSCLFLDVTGLPCPFCGMTRATFALLRGDLGAALGYHPLAPVVLAGLAAMVALVVTGRGHVLARRSGSLLVALAVIWAVRLAA